MTTTPPRDSAQLPPLPAHDAFAQVLFTAWQATPCSELDGEYTLRWLDLSPDYKNAWRAVARAALRAPAASVVPVLTVEKEPDYWTGGHFCEGSKPHINPMKVWALPIGAKLYTAPPTHTQDAPASLPADVEAHALTVWFGSMPESNGRENWTVVLRRKERPTSVTTKRELHHLMSGFTVCQSEYKDRMRYEADRLRFLVGEIEEDPHILDYDADLHSGYVEPQPVPPTIQRLREIVKGIDRDEAEEVEGWWTTEAGAEFGAKVLAQLETLFLEQAKAARSLCCDGKSEQNEYCCGLPSTSPATAVDAEQIKALALQHLGTANFVGMGDFIAALQASRQPVAQQDVAEGAVHSIHPEWLNSFPMAECIRLAKLWTAGVDVTSADDGGEGPQWKVVMAMFLHALATKEQRS